MRKIDINKVQRATYLNAVLKALLEINNNKHNDDKMVYNQKIVEALAIATAFQKHLPISSVETNVDIYFNQQYNMNISKSLMRLMKTILSSGERQLVLLKRFGEFVTLQLIQDCLLILYRQL